MSVLQRTMRPGRRRRNYTSARQLEPRNWEFFSTGLPAVRLDDIGQQLDARQDARQHPERDFLRPGETTLEDPLFRYGTPTAVYEKGRLVSFLEGGYNLDALARSVETHLRVLVES